MNALIGSSADKGARGFGNADTRSAHATKRIFDLAFCIAILPIVLLIAIPIVALIVLDGGNPFYSQPRVGRYGREFRCLKFRTMVIDADQRLAELLATCPASRAEWNTSRKLKGDPRLTWLGPFLRKTSLDELPQILNVLRGEMSLVGPRPVVMGELGMYGDSVTCYLACLPGITGLWQISGRNDVSYQTRVKFDREYAERWSVLLDVKVLLLTIPAVLARKGAY
jgi:undecaprenyl-phosphate galactose phosphotransferase